MNQKQDYDNAPSGDNLQMYRISTPQPNLLCNDSDGDGKQPGIVSRLYTGTKYAALLTAIGFALRYGLGCPGKGADLTDKVDTPPAAGAAADPDGLDKVAKYKPNVTFYFQLDGMRFKAEAADMTPEIFEKLLDGVKLARGTRKNLDWVGCTGEYAFDIDGNSGERFLSNYDGLSQDEQNIVNPPPKPKKDSKNL